MSRGPGRPHTFTYNQTTQGPGLWGLRMQAYAPSAGFPCGRKHAAGATRGREGSQSGKGLACETLSNCRELYGGGGDIMGETAAGLSQRTKTESYSCSFKRESTQTGRDS